MQYLIVLFVVCSIVSGAYFTGRDHGKKTAENECLEAQAEVIKDDTRRINNRPRTDSDTVKRLREWGDIVRKTEKQP